MNLFRIINDISEQPWMSVREKVFMLMKILVGVTPRRIGGGKDPGQEHRTEIRKRAPESRSREAKP